MPSSRPKDLAPPQYHLILWACLLSQYLLLSTHTRYTQLETPTAWTSRILLVLFTQCICWTILYSWFTRWMPKWDSILIAMCKFTNATFLNPVFLFHDSVLHLVIYQLWSSPPPRSSILPPLIQVLPSPGTTPSPSVPFQNLQNPGVFSYECGKNT
jgi:hypothetical protein